MVPFSFPVYTLLEEWQFTHQGGLTCLTNASQNVFMAPVSGPNRHRFLLLDVLSGVNLRHLSCLLPAPSWTPRRWCAQRELAISH